MGGYKHKWVDDEKDVNYFEVVLMWDEGHYITLSWNTYEVLCDITIDDMKAIRDGLNEAIKELEDESNE